MTKHYLADGLGNIWRQIFGRSLPTCWLGDRDLDGATDRLGVRSCEYIAAALDRLRTLGDITQRDIRNAEYRTFLLHGPAVGEYRESILFKLYEVQKPEGFQQTHLRRFGLKAL